MISTPLIFRIYVGISLCSAHKSKQYNTEKYQNLLFQQLKIIFNMDTKKFKQKRFQVKKIYVYTYMLIN